MTWKQQDIAAWRNVTYCDNSRILQSGELWPTVMTAGDCSVEKCDVAYCDNRRTHTRTPNLSHWSQRPDAVFLLATFSPHALLVSAYTDTTLACRSNPLPSWPHRLNDRCFCTDLWFPKTSNVILSGRRGREKWGSINGSPGALNTQQLRVAPPVQQISHTMCTSRHQFQGVPT